MHENALEEIPRHVARQQPVPVLSRTRRHPDRIVRVEADESAEEKVEVELLHEWVVQQPARIRSVWSARGFLVSRRRARRVGCDASTRIDQCVGADATGI